MMNLGTLENMISREEDVQKIKEFEAPTLILTGWDFAGHGKKYAEKYDVDAIVCESSILYIKPKGGWKEREIRRDLYTSEDLELIKEVNNKLMTHIYEKMPNSVLLSQANEAGICYYINPRREEKKKLTEFIGEEPRAKTFKEKLVKKYPELENSVDIISEKELSLPDSVENRYRIEKVNAKYYTFRPYRLEIKDGKLKVFLDSEQKEEWQFKDIEEIVQGLWDNGLGILSLREYLRIAPQTDGCIDVFPKTKRQTWREAIEKADLGEFNYIFYLSMNTESDIPFIVDAYREYEDRFYALGSKDTSSGLKRAGVISKETISGALEFIKKEGSNSK